MRNDSVDPFITQGVPILKGLSWSHSTRPELSERGELLSYGRTSGHASAVCHLLARTGQAGGEAWRRHLLSRREAHVARRLPQRSGGTRRAAFVWTEVGGRETIAPCEALAFSPAGNRNRNAHQVAWRSP